MSFLRAICCYHKSMDSVTFSVNIGTTSVCGGSGIPPRLSACTNGWNQALFSSSSGLGTRLMLTNVWVVNVSCYKLLSNMIRIHKPNYITITKACFKERGQTLVCTCVWLMYTTDVMVYLLVIMSFDSNQIASCDIWASFWIVRRMILSLGLSLCSSPV